MRCEDYCLLGYRTLQSIRKIPNFGSNTSHCKTSNNPFESLANLLHILETPDFFHAHKPSALINAFISFPHLFQTSTMSAHKQALCQHTNKHYVSTQKQLISVSFCILSNYHSQIDQSYTIRTAHKCG